MPTGRRRPTAHPRTRLALAAALALAVASVVAGCSSGSTPTTTPTTATPSTTAPPSTSTTEPGTEAVVFVSVDGNIDAYDSQAPYDRQRVVAAGTAPNGSEPHGQICFLPDGTKRFVVAETRPAVAGAAGHRRLRALSAQRRRHRHLPGAAGQRLHQSGRRLGQRHADLRLRLLQGGPAVHHRRGHRCRPPTARRAPPTASSSSGSRPSPPPPPPTAWWPPGWPCPRAWPPNRTGPSTWPRLRPPPPACGATRAPSRPSRPPAPPPWPASPPPRSSRPGPTG